MTRQTSAVAVLLLSSTWLASCSGAPGNGCIEACRGGNAAISFVLTATPPDPALDLSMQAFTANITGLTLTPSTGAAVNVPLNSSPYIAEFNRVTSDSTPLASKVSVPVGTYTQITVAFSAPRVTFCTQATPGVSGCVSGTLSSLSGAAGTATISTNLSVSDSLESGIALNVNLPSALTLSGQTVTAVNLAAANVFTAAALPPSATKTDLASAELSHVDDVMGLITSVSGSTLTVQTTTRGSITAAANSSTQFSTDCTTLGFSQDFTCVKANAAAVVDTLLNADGTFTLVFYQPLPTQLSSGDLIEGVVTALPNLTTNQVPIVVTDSVFAVSGSVLKNQLNLGDQVNVNVVVPPLAAGFNIISKGLTIPANSFAGSNSIADIHPGQTILFPVTAFTAQSGTTPGSTSTTTAALRFTRITAVMANPTLPLFSATTFPGFFGLATAQQFQTSSGRLSVDGVSILTNISNGSTFSTAALYLGPPASPIFASQSVRAH
jgi:hypothetical protein